MVFYLKINRNVECTFTNLQHWVLVCYETGADFYIICDDENLKQNVLKKVYFKDNENVKFIESNCKDTFDIAANIAVKRWIPAAYAHFTTFYHARENGFTEFYNIDADDTLFCISPVKTAEILLRVKEYAGKNNISALSLDMWYSRTNSSHWSFGITYIDNSIDWSGYFEKYSVYENFKVYKLNIDYFFTWLRQNTRLSIETFYVENLTFIHYGANMLQHPVSSGIYMWKNGHIEFPLLLHCMQLDKIGHIPIADDIIKIDAGLAVEDSKYFFVNFISDVNLGFKNDLCGQDIKIRYLDKFIKYTVMFNEGLNIVSNEKYVIYGTGITGRKVYNFIKLCNGEVLYACDSDKRKHGKKWLQKQLEKEIFIIPPEQLIEKRGSYKQIIIASVYYKEIEEYLTMLGMLKGKDFCTAKYLPYSIL